MHPPEPDQPAVSQPETTLELPDRPHTDDRAVASTELTVPEPAPSPPPMPAATEEQTEPGPLGNLVVAHFRRVEIAMLGRVLVSTLAGALPPSMIAVQHKRSFGRRRGEPVGITITAGDRVLSFRAPEVGVTEATIGHCVRGVVLSSTPVPVAQWLDALGEVLDEVTGNDEASRVALERALLA